jgi:hypothetical protein
LLAAVVEPDLQQLLAVVEAVAQVAIAHPLLVNLLAEIQAQKML